MDVAFTFQIVNKGNGFLSRCEDNPCMSGKTDMGPVIKRDQVSIASVTSGGGDGLTKGITGKLDEFFKDKCDGGKGYVKLIKKESTPMSMSIPDAIVGKVPTESTRTFKVTVGKYDSSGAEYCYEFRREIKVKVKPRF